MTSTRLRTGCKAAARERRVPAVPAVEEEAEAAHRLGAAATEEEEAMTLRLCLHCKRHYRSETGVRNRCADCGRAYDRQLSRQKRARRARNSAGWQKARAAARQRDGNRCTECGSTEGLQVHHIIPITQGGSEFDLSNLRTLASVVIRNSTTGGGGGDGKGSVTLPS
jgi:DNA-directed RNA polymerase subunit RPC12/RpoP